MSNSVWPQRWQPTRLPRPGDSPGKNTGVGCHCLLQCMKVKLLNCVQLSDRVDFSLPGSSVHGIFQARVLEWGAIAFSRVVAWVRHSVLFMAEYKMIGYSTFCLAIHQLMDTWVVPTFWLLCRAQVLTGIYALQPKLRASPGRDRLSTVLGVTCCYI